MSSPLPERLGATIFTDDFAIQNVAVGLGIAVQPLRAEAGKKDRLEIPVQRLRPLLQNRRGMPGLRLKY